VYRRVLVANRGEIACRIARTLRRMGISAVGVHSVADADALHVREIGESLLVGGAAARESYLDIRAVLEAAKRAGADAIHPGYGFLSENADFARACAQAGMAFIGPSTGTLALFGDKASAKRLARSLDIPVAAGFDEPSDDLATLLALGSELPRPFVLKAAAGGGGKGMRVVREGTDLRAAIEAAMREGRSAFGDGRLIAERYLAKPRHVEVQVLGDGRGGVIHLHDRECTLQRRHQKVIEEAPVTSIPQALRDRLALHALALGRASNYLGLGTVEFALTPEGAVFLEVNPRLQVEHTVTEAVTGLDLVQLQIEAVATRRLPFAQDELPRPRGVAVQARLYAEDARAHFLPTTGRLEMFDVPGTVRCDTGVAAGSIVTPHYDPMLAKLVAHGESREEAIAKLADAVSNSAVLGIVTNRGFLASLLAHPRVRANDVDTEFIDRRLAQTPAAAPSPASVAALCALWLANERSRAAAGAWGDASLTGWRLRRGGDATPPHTHSAMGAHESWRIGFGESGTVRVDDSVFRVTLPVRNHAGNIALAIDGCTLQLRAVATREGIAGRVDGEDLSLDIAPLHQATRGQAGSALGTIRAPMMGIVIAVDAQPGRRVLAGERLAVIESMKMELALDAPTAGVVAWVGCEARDKVERHQELFRIEPAA
jgi:acetyl/propionyl-CoA carboxylase alpha subunit